MPTGWMSILFFSGKSMPLEHQAWEMNTLFHHSFQRERIYMYTSVYVIWSIIYCCVTYDKLVPDEVLGSSQDQALSWFPGCKPTNKMERKNDNYITIWEYNLRILLYQKFKIGIIINT